MARPTGWAGGLPPYNPVLEIILQERKKESGKRKAEKGKRKKESGKRKAEKGKRKKGNGPDHHPAISI
jgi:hypothetical protein